MDGSSVSLNKLCVKCGESKPASVEFFYRAPRNRSGLASWCRECMRVHRVYPPRKTPVYTPEVFESRFWSKVDKCGPVPAHAPQLGPCWVWTAYRNPFGYGEVGRKNPRRVESTHRVSWELHAGLSAGDLCVLHKCDNPACVNPTHLFLGTRSENMDDKVRKGRQHRGERSPNAILRESDVPEIRRRLASGESQSKIGAAFGVKRVAISAIATGRAWKHVK